MHTACYLMAQLEKVPSVCQVKTAGLCSPVDDICATSANMATRKTKCMQDSAGGKTCGCEEGWKLEGDVCVDVNECADDIVCPYKNSRNVCENFEGTYSCALRLSCVRAVLLFSRRVG